VVHAITRQDLQALQSYLEDRVITGFDAIVAPGSYNHHYSLLDYAITVGCIQIVELFLANKWFIRQKRYHYMITCNTLISFQSSLWQLGSDFWQASQPAKKFLELLDAVEPEEDDDFASLAEHLRGSPLYCADDIFDLLWMQPQTTQVMLGSTEPGPHYRAFQAMCASTPANFEAMLGGKLSRHDAFRICRENQTITPRRLLKTIYENQEGHTADWLPWSDIIRDLRDFVTQQEPWEPGLDGLDRLIWDPYTNQHYLHQWLFHIQSLGIDLESYGHNEFAKLQALRRRGPHSLIFIWTPVGKEERFVGFTYGSQPSNWAEYWTPHGWEYEWAGEFWDWIENPENFMPGAFPKAFRDGDYEESDD
jgi:hypothetical protein